MDSLGRRIQKLRKQKNLTQQELATVIGISRGSLSMIEIDKREPDNQTLKKFADFFNVSTDYLLGRTDDPSYQTDELSEKELEEIIKKEGIMFDGIPLDEEDKEDIIEVMKIAWKTLQRRKHNKSK
ncbi:MAG: helix-turn-helix transcriptional regulator [Thermoanaerobacteraceae bacterium]|nr:helix-turn-helix transcriptional regulator [Thermoanaerobacteraceae bacterium]